MGLGVIVLEGVSVGEGVGKAVKVEEVEGVAVRVGAGARKPIHTSAPINTVRQNAEKMRNRDGEWDMAERDKSRMSMQAKHGCGGLSPP